MHCSDFVVLVRLAFLGAHATALSLRLRGAISPFSFLGEP
jgi:hypothetical protein